MIFTCRAHGIPAAKGSKKFVGLARSGRGIMVESSKKEKPWREAVTRAVLDANAASPVHFDGAVRMTIQFILPRPTSEPKGWTRHHTRKPDIEKLCRSVSDAINDAALWEDDACVVELMATKITAEPGEPPGCLIIIEALPPKENPNVQSRKRRAKPDQPALAG